MNNKTGGEIIGKKVSVVLQDGIKDCGVSALLSIIKSYGGQVGKEYLKELTNTTKNGVTAYHLIEAASFLGFSCQGVFGDIQDLNNEKLPCIAHVIINKSYQHFIVIYDIDFKNQKLLIMDPAKGKKILSFHEFNFISSHQYILLKPQKQIPTMTVKKVVKETILKQIKKRHSPLILAFIFSFLFLIFQILSAYHFKYLMEYAISLNSISNASTISIAILFIFLLKEFSQLIRNLFLLKWSDTYDFSLTSQVFDQIISFPYLYYKNRTTGEILTRFKDLGGVKNFVAIMISLVIPECFSFIFFLMLLIHLNFRLTVYLIFFFILFLFLEVLCSKPYKKRRKRYLLQEEKLNSYLIEVLSAVDAMKGLHMEKQVQDKFLQQYKKFLSRHYQISFFSYIENFLKNNLDNFMMIFILFWATIFVIKEDFSLSEMIIFQSLLMYEKNIFSNLISFLKEFFSYRLAKERIEDLFSISKEKFTMKEYFFDQNLAGNICFCNFTYFYHSYPVLKEINLEIPYGNKVFIYGDSGGGKSTLVKSLLRYVEVPYGQIKINGMDINHYHLNTLRSRITYVSQNEYLFTNTIKYNLLLEREISADALDLVIEKMQLREIIDHSSLGLSTIIEENGFNLSGGERQRLILARSILKESDIYILDEATSQIDIEKEREILKNLFSLLKEKTIIFISHRLNNQDLFNQKIRVCKGSCYEEKI